MLSEIEKKRFELEMQKVQLAKAEMEFRILEREEEIKRIKDQIEIQNKRVDEIKKILTS